MAKERLEIELDLDTKPAELDVQRFGKKASKTIEKSGETAGKAFSKGFTKEFSNTFKSVKDRLTSFKSLALAAGAAFSGAFVANKAVQEASRLESSLTGLRAVAANFGSDFKAIEQAAQSFASDGAIPLTDVTATLQNLLINFNGDVDKSVQAFTRLRDAAAFNRQGTLELGEALRGASEGLRNDNSIKVDNAGITTNLSIAYKEYAKELGVVVTALTSEQKAQAELNLLNKEGAIFTGNYNTSLQTFSGQLSRVTGSFRFLLAEIGKFTTRSPVVLGFFKTISDFIVDATKSLNEFRLAGDLKSFNDNVISAGEIITKFLIIPIEVLYNIGKTVFGAIETFILGFISTTAGAVSAIASFIPGLDDFAKKADEVSIRSFRGLVASANETGEAFKNVFNPQTNEFINGFFKKFRENVASIQPGIDIGTDKVKEFKEKSVKELSEFGKQSNQIFKSFQVSLGVTFGKTLGNALTEGSSAFDNFGKSLLGVFGDLLIQLGTAAISIGVLGEAIGKSVVGLTGGPAIAAGIASIALGTVLKSFSKEASKSIGTSGSSAVSSAAASSPAASAILEEDSIEAPEERQSVVVNINGDVFDTEETFTRVFDIINRGADTNNLVINRNALA